MTELIIFLTYFYMGGVIATLIYFAAGKICLYTEKRKQS